MQVALTVFEEPVPKLRAKIYRLGDRVRGVTPTKTRKFEALIKAQAEVMGVPPLEGALRLTIKIYRSIPKSFSKIKQKRAINGLIRPTTKPDLDNYIKIVDALNGVFWKDDSQIVEYGEGTGKYYSDQPRLEIIVEQLKGG